MGYPDYSVDTEGNIWSIGYNNTKEIKKMKPAKTKGGYLRLPLTINNKAKSYLVHRLVALAFIPNPNNYPEVNHKNEDKTDNRVENLEWCDRSYNINYSYQKQENKDCRGKMVAQYDKQGNLICEYPSLGSAAEATNGSLGGISNCCHGRTKTSGGYVWKFTESSTTKYQRNPS